MPRREIEGRPRRGGCLYIAILLFAVLIGARTFASLAIDYQWWQEMGQLQTWFKLLLYQIVPASAAVLLAFVVFWIAHARGMKHAGTRLRDYPLYAVISTLALL